MSASEDTIPKFYNYAWTQEHELSLQDFLNKYKPSMVQNDGTKPWIWVRKSAGPYEPSSDEACAEAFELLQEMTEKIEAIKNDPSIPTRSNKKTGAKSKKELREQLQAETTTKLEEIATKHNCVCGKWLSFAPSDKVDRIWSHLATSLITGPLSTTQAFTAKVSTSPQSDTPHYQHVICLYLPNVYDQPAVTEVMKILLRNHGLNLSGVKSDLYTVIGLDSKHPSGVQSTVWKNTNLMKDSEIKQLKDEFFASLKESSAIKGSGETANAGPSAGPSSGEPKADGEPSSPKAKSKPKPKPKLKRKAKDDDPFASASEDDKEKKKESKKTGNVGAEDKPPKDDDGDANSSKGKIETETKSKTKSKPKLKKKAKVGEDDPFGSASEGESGEEVEKEKGRETKRTRGQK